MTIIETIKSLRETADENNSFVLAATINLYNESLQRLTGRVIYAPEDAKGLLLILQTLFTAGQHAQTFAPAKRRRDNFVEELQRVANEAAAE